MENNTINIFTNILDDSDNILKKIRIEVYEKLDLGGYEQFNEFVKESLEHFSFNISERNFFEQIRIAVIEQIGKNDLKIKNGETVDYGLFTSDLISQLKKIGQVDFNFDDDFRNLAKNINNKFPMIASDEWYVRLNSRKEQIVSMINKYNQDIVETLIKLTPKLAIELSAIESRAKSNSNDNQILQQSTHQNEKKEEVPIQSAEMSDDFQQSEYIKNNKNFIITLRERCWNKVDELKLIVNNLKNSNPELARECSLLVGKLIIFYGDLEDINYAQNILNQYPNSNIVDQKELFNICEEILNQNFPELKDVYKKVDFYLNENPKISDGPKPEPTPSVSTYIGATNEDVEKLIKANEYYSLLHGIDKESFMKYNRFIQTGFSLITSDYYNRAASCKTLEERLQALKELKQIHENFNGYITMEQSNQLRETIEKMTNYLQKQQSQHLVDDIGIRYNSARKDETRSSRRM